MFNINYYPECDKKYDNYLYDKSFDDEKPYDSNYNSDFDIHEDDYEYEMKRPIPAIYAWFFICLILGIIGSHDFFFGIFTSIIIMAFTSPFPLITYAIVTHSRAKNLRAHGVSKNNPLYLDYEIKAGIAAMGAASTFHASYEGIKKLTK